MTRLAYLKLYLFTLRGNLNYMHYFIGEKIGGGITKIQSKVL